LEKLVALQVLIDDGGVFLMALEELLDELGILGSSGFPYILKLRIGCLDLLLRLLRYHFFTDLQDVILEPTLDLVEVVV
jgi:hypothetical protein